MNKSHTWSSVRARVITTFVIVIFASSAKAATLSFDYTGTIITSPDGIVPVSTNFSGSFSYDDTLAGSTSSSGTIYFPADFSLNIDSTLINFVGVINVDDNSTSTLPGFDVIQIGRFGITPNPVLNGTLLNGISIDLTDSTQSVLSDESLPLDFDLADWSVGGRLLAIRPLNSTNITLGRIDTIVSTVPVPGAIWLFGSGLLGLVGIARRKKA